MRLFTRHILAGLTLGAVLLIGISNSWAHDHSGQGMSPFHGKDRHHAVHCDFLGHDIHKPCPLKHRQPKDKSESCFLSSDCGGGTAQQPGSLSHGSVSHAIQSTMPAILTHPEMVRISNSISQYPSIYPVSLEHPPRTLSASQS